MSVCLSVCLFVMHLKIVRANATTLPKNTLHIQGTVDIHFLFQKNNASLAKGTPV